MKKTIIITLLALFVAAGIACAPRQSDPAEFITLNKQRELQLLGEWKLLALKDGRAPQPHETKTLIFQNDNTLQMDLWEHRLTFKYQVMPDPDHLTLTWIASTNPNDKPAGAQTLVLKIQGDDLTLDGDQYKRIALASGATLTPSSQTATAIPTASATAQAALATPTSASTGADVVNAQLGEIFVLHLKQTGLLTDTPDQFGISLYAITQDSRCPKEVTCVWSGEVRAQIVFQQNGILHPPIFELTTLPNDPKHRVAIDNYLVELVDVQPPRSVNQEIAPQQYALTFRVTRAPQGTATSTPPNGFPTYALDQPFTIKMFQRVDIRDAQFSVTMNGVLEESRCPKSVNCVQAGRALLSFLLERNQRLGMFALSTMPPDGRTRAYFQGYAVELLDVQPYPETPDQKPEPREYSATLVVRRMSAPTNAIKNQAFVLHPGESAQITDEQVQVKFVRVTSDSRCPYGVACTVRGNAAVEATLTDANGTTYTFILNTDSDKQNQRIPDSGFYGMELIALAPYPRADFASQEIAPEEYEATFVVRKFASTQPVPTKTPTAAKPQACLGLTARDAEAVLGQPVIEELESDVNISVAASDTSAYKPRGLCGYTTVEKVIYDAMDMTSPYVWGPPFAVGAVTAERLQGEKTLELLRIANILLESKRDPDTTPFLILQARLAAGDRDGFFDTLRELAQGSAEVHFENVDSFGDAGLWIWRAAPINHYAALIVREKDSFVVVEALFSNAMNEEAAKESLHTAMGKMMK